MALRIDSVYVPAPTASVSPPLSKARPAAIVSFAAPDDVPALVSFPDLLTQKFAITER
jgi:hypothetical protein